MSEEEKACRNAFVQAYEKINRCSLKPHCNGQANGFDDILIQGRWKFFKMGWFASRDWRTRDFP